MSDLSWPSCVLADGIQLISGRHIQASGCNTDGFGMPYLTGPEDFPYAVPPSRYYEIKYHAIGKIISASCYVIGMVHAVLLRRATGKRKRLRVFHHDAIFQ